MLKWLTVWLVMSHAVACQRGLPPGDVHAADLQASADGKVAAQATETPLTLQFDLPREFSNRSANKAYAITGFRIGFFRRGDMNPLATTDVNRDAVETAGRTARITLPRPQFPVGQEEVVVRIQSLAGERASEWSESWPLAETIDSPPPAAARRAAPARGSFVPSDIDKHPLLEATLRKMVPPDASLEVLVKPFRRVEDVALAAVICRDHDVPFTAIADLLGRSPRLSVTRAVRQVRPGWRPGRPVMVKARADARQLLAPPAK